MAIRTISAFVALPLLFIVLYFAPPWALPLALALISLACVHELTCATGFLKAKSPAALFCMIASVAGPIFTYYVPALDLVAGLLLLVVCLFAIGIFNPAYMTFDKISGAFFAAFVVPYFLSGIARISLREDGIYYTIVPFAVAWCSDSMAYFVGRALGRHKLCPEVSPKKTVEGALGGVLGGMVGLCLVGLVMARFFSRAPNYPLLVLLGGVGSVVSQVGDLSMSLIKRNFSIKDYGSIMPGHGGVLDRFDSVLFVTPMVEIFLNFFPGIL